MGLFWSTKEVKPPLKSRACLGQERPRQTSSSGRIGKRSKKRHLLSTENKTSRKACLLEGEGRSPVLQEASLSSPKETRSRDQDDSRNERKGNLTCLKKMNRTSIDKRRKIAQRIRNRDETSVPCRVTTQAMTELRTLRGKKNQFLRKGKNDIRRRGGAGYCKRKRHAFLVKGKFLSTLGVLTETIKKRRRGMSFKMKATSEEKSYLEEFGSPNKGSSSSGKN